MKPVYTVVYCVGPSDTLHMVGQFSEKLFAEDYARNLNSCPRANTIGRTPHFFVIEFDA